MYNLVMRMAENDYLPACAYYGIGVAPFSPLARGALTGKYDRNGQPPAGSRAARGDNSLMTRDLKPRVLEVVEALRAHVAGRDLSLAEFAVQWVLANRTVTSVIAGPRTLEQWQSYIAAMDKALGPEDESIVDALVAKGHPATPGLVWARHPPLGRVV